MFLRKAINSLFTILSVTISNGYFVKINLFPRTESNVTQINFGNIYEKSFILPSYCDIRLAILSIWLLSCKFDHNGAPIPVYEIVFHRVMVTWKVNRRLLMSLILLNACILFIFLTEWILVNARINFGMR